MTFYNKMKWKTPKQDEYLGYDLEVIIYFISESFISFYHMKYN